MTARSRSGPTRVTVDVGNSTFGIGLWSGDEVAVCTFGQVDEAVRHLGSVADGVPVLVGSVAPRRLACWLDALGQARRAAVTVLTEPAIALADATLAHSAGADRIAAAIALLPGPGVVVDAGTAVTVDVVDAGGVYRGGFIAPGPAALGSALSDMAEQLPAVDPRPMALAPGVDTVAAMERGAWGMAVGGVDRLVLAARELIGGAGPILATGGWGADWAAVSRWAHEVAVDPVLVHRGLARWADRA